MGRSTFTQVAYHLIKLTPAITFLLFGTFQRWISEEDINSPFSALLICIVSLVVWGMAEGTVLLWHKARIAPDAEHRRRSRGYVIVTFLLALLLIPLLFLFRERVTQPLFVALLVAFSFRGLSRTAWDQQKGLLAVGATLLSAFILAALSFAIFRQTSPLPVTWQALLISVAMATSILALELPWNATSSKTLGKRQTPIFRTAMFTGPVIVGTLAFIGQLPLCYSGVYLVIPLCHRAVTASSNRGEVTDSDVPPTVLALSSFFFLIILCRAYENGWFR